MKEKKNNPNMKKEDPEEHPALIFEQSKTHYKAIHFTSHRTTKGIENVKLKYNIDPDERKRSTYAVPYKEPQSQWKYQKPDKNYRIHKEDLPIIKKMKNRKK